MAEGYALQARVETTSGWVDVCLSPDLPLGVSIVQEARTRIREGRELFVRRLKNGAGYDPRTRMDSDYLWYATVIFPEQVVRVEAAQDG